MKKEIEEQFGKIEVELEGLSPLLMHNIEGADLEGKTTTKIKKYDLEEEAEKSAYWTSNGGKKQLCVPARCIHAMLLNAAKPFRQKNMSVANLLAGAIRIEPFEIPLGTDKYVVDKQAVVVQKARIIRARPRLDEWKLKFNIMYHREYVGPDVLERILKDGGFKVGLLDYRPQKKGPYGTYRLSRFKVIN